MQLYVSYSETAIGGACVESRSGMSWETRPQTLTCTLTRVSFVKPTAPFFLTDINDLHPTPAKSLSGVVFVVCVRHTSIDAEDAKVTGRCHIEEAFANLANAIARKRLVLDRHREPRKDWILESCTIECMELSE